MFKYNKNIVIPFVILFIICCLFYLINKNNLNYNTVVEENNLSNIINSCNKKEKNLNIIPSRKKNNSKIMNYIFENLEIKENYSNINNIDNISSLKLDKETIDNMKSDLIKKKSKVFLKDSIRKKDLELKIKNLTNQQNNLHDKMNNNLESVKDNPIIINTDIQPTATTTIPNDYPGIFQFGNPPDDFQDSESLGCRKNTLFEDAKQMCKEANDCNSFFAYEGKPGMSGRVCFKDNAQRDKEKIPSNVTNYPNSGYYFV